MNTRFKFIIAVMASGAVFASCTKDVTPPNSENDEIVQATEASRVISVSFSPQTKTTLEGFQPKFEEGDSILISNGEVLDTCEVSVNGDNATFTTELDGLLKAVYPYKAAAIDGSDISGVLVSTEQDGTFASANICMAKDIMDKAVFENKTAVFRITPGAATNTKYVEVITSGPEIANTTTTEYTKKNKIHVATDDGGEVFVSVLVPDGGLKLRDLSFADGSNMKTVTDATKGATEIAANTIYTIKGDSGWDKPYVEIEMTVNNETKKYKWATMNVGAENPTDAGKYFAWGDINGQTPSGSSFSPGFGWDNAPFNNGQSSYDATYFTLVKDTECPNGILALKNDAANANWGGSWRMPTKEEFDALCSLSSKEWKPDYNNSGVNGYLFTYGSNSIFLPAAGFGDGTDLSNAGDFGSYWSSSLYAVGPSFAYYLDFIDDDAYMSNYFRYYGQSVRALSE